MFKPLHPVLAQGRVRFVGEAGGDGNRRVGGRREDARDLIEIEYRDLPVAATFARRSAAGAPQLHAGVPGNLAFEY